MAVENQNILDKKVNVDQSQIDTRRLKESLQSWGDRTEKKQEDHKQIEEVVRNLVSANIPINEMEEILNKLPISKRFIAERMILDEQRRQRATMSQEKYKVYLQSQFPNGVVPSHVGEMALSFMADTSEMHKQALAEIQKTTAGESPSEIAKKEFKNEQRTAVVVTQGAEEKTKKITDDIARIT